MKNLTTTGRDGNALYGMDVIPVISCPRLETFVLRVVPAFKDLQFTLFGSQRVQVSDEGTKLGNIYSDVRGQYHTRVLRLRSPRMKDKRNHETATENIDTAVKMFSKYFTPDSNEQVVDHCFNALSSTLNSEHHVTETKLQESLSQAVLNFFHTGNDTERTVLYHMLALPNETKERIEDLVLKYKDSYGFLAHEDATVIVKRKDKYLVKPACGSPPVEVFDEVPPQYRRQIGLLKLAQPCEVIPDVGVKISNGRDAYLCKNLKPV